MCDSGVLVPGPSRAAQAEGREGDHRGGGLRGPTGGPQHHPALPRGGHRHGAAVRQQVSPQPSSPANPSPY